jgi:cell division initiation protein
VQVGSVPLASGLMEISPKTFREVEFREKRHGYHPEDVDQFLEQMATEVEALQDRMRQTLERAQRAEQAASESGNSDETLRRTLILAQRTADLAVQESRDQAARVLASAEQQAQALLAEAEDRARRLHGEALADVHAELAKFEGTRTQAQEQVNALNRWAGEHRSRLIASLREALEVVEQAGAPSPAPTSTPIETPAGPRRAPGPAPLPPASPPEDSNGRAGLASPRPVDAGPGPAPAAPPPSAPQASGPPPVPPQGPRPAPPGSGPGAASAADGQPTQAMPVIDVRTADRPGGETSERDMLTDPDDVALDNYFDDNSLADERRFGGRRRRRR